MIRMQHVWANATVRPYPNFNVNADCESLQKAWKSKNRDQEVIDILCKRSNAQRQEIRHRYKQLYGEDFIEKLVNELKGHLEDVVVALVNTPAEFDARELHQAMCGVGTAESTLLEILSTRSNAEIRDIKAAFHAMFEKDLDKAIDSDTTGSFKRLLILLAEAKRDENPIVNRERAKKSAHDLLTAGVGKFGTDDATFNNIFSSQSFQQLEAVSEEYKKLAGHDLTHAINMEFKGEIKESLLAIVEIAHNTPEFFAKTAYLAMKGLGTNDRNLIRVVVSRSEKDLKLIKAAFQNAYGKSLETWIKDDTSGAYKDALITLVQGN